VASIRVRVVVDSRESAEEEAADVGEDGSATGGDASLREEGVEGAEGIVDALGVLEARSLLGERFKKINGFSGLQRLAGMVETESSRRIYRGHTAAAVLGAVPAAGRFWSGVGGDWVWFHFGSSMEGVYPPVFL
jgi:hypothetical protein